MDGDFSSIRIDGGMFSPEFLKRIADANPDLEGCSPADYSKAEEGLNNLRDYLNQLWNRSITVWNRFGPSKDEEIPAARVKVFIKRLMRDIGLDLIGLQRHESSGNRPQLTYNLGGSLWHVVASDVNLDQRSETIGTRRTSPHNLVQGELTSSEHHGWGLLTNGRQVRILRKTNRPSIQEALEFDIETMFNDRLYPDFCLFAMMVHGTRWSRSKDAPMDCWLETWYKASKEEGLSVLEDLRGCVQLAANALGTGLIRFQAGNQDLRDRLRVEAGLADELQREIMRYMYKLIFLFVMEDRNLLLRGHGEDLTPELETARERYMLEYSTQRHRSVVATTKGDENHNFFEEVKQVISFLYKGEERLALPALGSYLFSDKSTKIIDGCTLLNTDFMKMLYHLCTFKKKNGSRQSFHWKTLRETELGSVYESLLELRPSIDLDNGTFTLASEAGNDRKSSGSYYTPAELVDHLITSTIEPLLDEAKKKAKKEAGSPDDYPRLAQEAILKLTVCDPACGSGHFLVAALERIAMELARIETGEHHPGISFIRKWKRLASSRCIYGVDLNPLAVELCKVAIWMDTYDGTNPFSFLDGHIRHGNSLLGQRLEKMGLIPDDAIPKAWVEQRKEHRKFNRKQLKKATEDAELRLKNLQHEYDMRKKRSKVPTLGSFDDGFQNSLDELGESTIPELKKQMDLIKEAIEEKEAQKLLPPEIVWSTVDLPRVIADIAAQQAKITLMEEGSLEQIEHKITQLQQLNTDERSNWAKEVLNASMAMWWWPDPDINEHNQMMADPPVPLASFELNRYATWLAYQYGIEDDVLSNHATATHNFSNDETRFRLIREHTERIADEQLFFHWELEFAEVFFGEVEKRGGFLGLIGNPPYLGGSKISNLYGSIPSKVLRETYDGGAKADLIAYFTKNGFSMLGLNGYIGMVTTNALRSGESRDCGLAPLLKKKSLDDKNYLNAKASRGRITNASTDIVWPGDAAVTVDLITIKNETIPIIGSTKAVLNQTPVNRLISSRLNLRPDEDPVKIQANKTISQRGVNPRGPFQITSEQYDLFVKSNAANSDILKPWLSGDDINAQGVPTKFIVDVNHLELKDLDRYPAVRDYLLENVKVKRDELNPSKPEYSLLREKWWRWEFAAPTIQTWFNDHELIFAKSRHATRWIIGQIDKGPVLSEGTVAFFFDDHAMFAVLQSFLHEDWSREFGSTLGSAGHRYTNNCIDTYPFPIEPTDEALEFARKQSQNYLRLRESVCKALECTINELHGFVDDSTDCRDEVVTYRTAMIELDKAAMQLYRMPTEGYSRIHREDLGRFFPPQDVNLECFGLLTKMNRFNVPLDRTAVMGLFDYFKRNKKAVQTGQDDQSDEIDTTNEDTTADDLGNWLVDVTTNPTEPQAEEITQKEERPDEEKKRFVIYGHRKPLSSTSNDINLHQLKIGKAALVPNQSDILYTGCTKASLNHPEKEKDAFEVVIQRLKNGDAILGGIGKADGRRVFEANAADFLPVVIDLEEIFPEEKWYDKSDDPHADDKDAHSLLTVEKKWIHKPLKQEGQRVNPEWANDEWFYVDPHDDAEALKNQIIKLIQRGLGHSEGLDYEALERPHQYWVRKRLLDLAETNGKQWDAMLELAPRFGKTSCIMGYWWLDTDAPLLIVEAYFLSALTSFEQAASKWNTGTDAKVYHLTEENAPKIKADLEDNKRVILLVSQHLAPEQKQTTIETEAGDVLVKEPSEAETIDYTENDSGEPKQWVIDLFSVTNEYDAVVYVDEADFGSHTERSAFITELAASQTENMRHVLHGTGTNIERASRHGRKMVDLVRVTYSDLLEAKEGEGYLFADPQTHSSSTGEDEAKALEEFRSEPEKWQDRLQNIVTPVYVKLTVGEEMRKSFEEDTKLTPDWRSIYKHATTNSAKRTVRDFFSSLLDEKFGEEPYSLHQVFEGLRDEEGLPSPFENQPFAMLVWCGPEKEHVHLMASQAQAALGDQYLYEEVTGENTTNRAAEAYAKSRIRKARAENKKGVIFFSSNMSSRSFSIPEITVVMDCYDGGSIHVAHQKHSRALTPGPGKTHGYIINMSIDPNRAVESHFEQKIILDTVHAQGLETTDIKDQIVRRIRLQPLYRWSQEDDGAPIPIQAEEIERLALDADRVVDMLMYNSEHIINEMMQSEGILNTIINIAGADSDLKSAHQSLQRLLDINDDHEDDDDDDDDPVTQSTDDSEPEEAEEEVDSDDDDEEALNKDEIRSILRNMVIIVQNIALQIHEDEAEDIFSALKLIEGEDGMDDALKYWTGGVGAAEFSSSLKQINERMMNSAFRIARTSDQFKWLEVYQGGEDDA